MSTLSVQVPRAFLPLLDDSYRYFGAYGGRGSGKSQHFAGRVVEKAALGERWVCVREVQNSIKDSVKTLVERKIAAFGLGYQFDTQEAETRGPNGGLVTYRGMQSYNAENIKSLEDFDGVWVEEAQTFSQHSLDMLRPTLRKANSKLYFSWNPRYKTDAVDKFFRRNAPANAVSVLVNWHDNPWFGETSLMDDMRADYANDPVKAEHVWGGGYGVAEGSILGRWMSKARREGRVHDEVEHDRDGAPIVVSADLGFRDTAGWWYWQPTVGGFRVLAYDGDSGLDADDWIPRVQDKLRELGADRNLGMIWLPHDARAKTFQSKHTSAEKFIKAFGADKVRIVPISSKADRISAARTVIDRCEFAETACEDGISGLDAWEYEYSHDLQTFSREPLHNWASHPSDAFSYGCQVMAEHVPPPTLEKSRFPVEGMPSGRIVTAPIETLWRDAPTAQRY